MSEFVGRTGSKRAYSYPDTRPGGNALLAFARNYANGPALESNPTVDGPVTGTEIPWATRDVPGTDPEDIPITPRSTGIIVVRGVVSLRNTSETDIVDVQVQVEIGTVTPVAYPVPANEKISVPIDDGEGLENRIVVPFMVEIPGLPIGTTQIVRVLLTADAENLVQIVENSSTCEVAEVSVATG